MREALTVIEWTPSGDVIQSVERWRQGPYWRM